MNWLHWFSLACYGVAIVFLCLAIKDLRKAARLNAETDRILRGLRK